MKKRLMKYFLILMLSFVFAGCGSGSTDSSNSKSDVYRSAKKEFDFLIDAVEKKDKEALKDKFSVYACKNIDGLDEKIERLIDEFPGYEGNETINDTFERHSNHGKITCAYTPSFDFTVNDAVYRMRIIYYVKSDEDPDKSGWYSIQLYKRHDQSYSDKMYTHGIKDDPDILLWDYTKDK